MMTDRPQTMHATMKIASAIVKPRKLVSNFVFLSSILFPRPTVYQAYAEEHETKDGYHG